VRKGVIPYGFQCFTGETVPLRERGNSVADVGFLRILRADAQPNVTQWFVIFVANHPGVALVQASYKQGADILFTGNGAHEAHNVRTLA